MAADWPNKVTAIVAMVTLGLSLLALAFAAGKWFCEVNRAVPCPPGTELRIVMDGPQPGALVCDTTAVR